MADFQQGINVDPAPGIEGDFASANVYGSMLTGPGALVACALGVLVGRFARARNDNGQVSNGDPGVPSRVGFMARAGQTTIIVAWLGKSALLVTAGREVVLHDSGDFWVRFPAGAAIGQKAFAAYADGSAVAGLTGSTPATASATGSVGASVTGSIAGTVLTVTAVAAGVLSNGQVLTGTGVTANTTVLAQTSGTAGGVGTYTVNTSQTVGSTTVTATGTLLTVTAVGSGTLAVGDPVSGTGVTAGSTIAALGTGTGGVGTYVLSAPQQFASTALTALAALETAWWVHSTAAAGELAMISVRRIN